MHPHSLHNQAPHLPTGGAHGAPSRSLARSHGLPPTSSTVLRSTATMRAVASSPYARTAGRQVPRAPRKVLWKRDKAVASAEAGMRARERSSHQAVQSPQQRPPFVAWG